MKDVLKFTITSGAMLDSVCHQLGKMLMDNGWVTVEAKVGNRSLSQNSLYWEWMTVIADHVNSMKMTVSYTPEEIEQYGFEPEATTLVVTKEEMHDTMRQSFLGHVPAKKVGKMLIKPQLKSTTDLTKGEMFHYMEQVNAYWAGMGLLLPIPEDSVYMKTRKEHEGG